MNFAPRFDVLLHGRNSGTISTRGTTVAFQFADSFLTDLERPVLGLRLEESLRQTDFSDRRMPNWFANLLPEGALRELVERSIGVSPDLGNLFEHEAALFEAIGADLPGAVQLLPSSLQGIDLRSEPQAPDNTEEDEDAGQALRFSVAGVGLKLSLLQDRHRFTIPARGRTGRWLVKFPDPKFPHLPQNEYAVMRLAKRVGIEVPELQLVHRDAIPAAPDSYWGGEEYAYAIKRFDRSDDGTRVHIEDFAQVRGLPPNQKYSGNYETIASIAYRRHDRASLEEFARRLAFCLAIGNSDAHLKNWSLIYHDHRRPSLSPAYDLVSVMPYADRGVNTELALRFANRKRYDFVTLDDFDRMGRKLNSDLDLRDIATRTVSAVADNMARLREDLVDHPEIYDSIAKHLGDIRPKLT